ncbi:hypothetical protein C8R42DRAFT_726358 [Lentinula raphanica]|nr:hypothetical protein C8R42DRAFT_726358 [Lentinula raphanica]
MATQTPPVMTLHVELLIEIFNHVLSKIAPGASHINGKSSLDLPQYAASGETFVLGNHFFGRKLALGCTIPTSSTQILPLLAQHSERWLDVTLMFPSSFCTLLSSIKGRLPLLKTLIWISGMDLDDLQNVPDFPGFEIAPSLCGSHLSLPFLKEMIILPWSQLTQLTCEFVHWSSLHSTLPLMHNLFLLCVIKPVVDSTNDIDRQSVTYPRLSSLEVEDCDFRILHSLLHVFPDIRRLTIAVFEQAEPHDLDRNETIHLLHLSSIRFEIIHQSLPSLSNVPQMYAPNLSKLEFLSTSKERRMDVLSQRVVGNSMLRSLANFISRACCSLKTLKLAFAIDFDCDEMGSLFRSTPNLEDMDISVVHGMECIPWRSMTPISQNLPQLKTFALHIPCDVVPPETLTDLVAFVRSNNLLKITFSCMD